MCLGWVLLCFVCLIVVLLYFFGLLLMVCFVYGVAGLLVVWSLSYCGVCY